MKNSNGLIGPYMRALLFVFMIFSVSSVTHAANLSGTVLKKGGVLVNVEIKFYSRIKKGSGYDYIHLKSIRTDSQGRYEYKNLRRGWYKLEIVQNHSVVLTTHFYVSSNKKHIEQRLVVR